MLLYFLLSMDEAQFQQELSLLNSTNTIQSTVLSGDNLLQQNLNISQKNRTFIKLLEIAHERRLSSDYAYVSLHILENYSPNAHLEHRIQSELYQIMEKDVFSGVVLEIASYFFESKKLSRESIIDTLVTRVLNNQHPTYSNDIQDFLCKLPDIGAARQEKVVDTLIRELNPHEPFHAGDDKQIAYLLDSGFSTYAQIRELIAICISKLNINSMDVYLLNIGGLLLQSDKLLAQEKNAILDLLIQKIQEKSTGVYASNVLNSSLCKSLINFVGDNQERRTQLFKIMFDMINNPQNGGYSISYLFADLISTDNFQISDMDLVAQVLFGKLITMPTAENAKIIAILLLELGHTTKRVTLVQNVNALYFGRVLSQHEEVTINDYFEKYNALPDGQRMEVLHAALNPFFAARNLIEIARPIVEIQNLSAHEIRFIVETLQNKLQDPNISRFDAEQLTALIRSIKTK